MKKYIHFLIFFLLIAATGCKDYLDVNTNPNAPTVTVPGPVLAGALVASASIYAGGLDPAMYWAGMVQSSGTYASAGNVRFNFNLTTGNYSGQWASLYLNASNYNFVQNAATATKGGDNMAAIARIMKVWCFQQLVDVYNNVPYTEALNGSTIYQPQYDDAKAIYKSLSLELDDVVKSINSRSGATAVSPTADVMFGGDMAMWVKFANTLNLRLLIHQTNVAGQDAFIKSEIAGILANGGGFLTADALINPGYAKTTNNQNPFWENNGLGVGGDIGGRDFHRCSDYALKYFTSRNDPRRDMLFRQIGNTPGDNSGSTGYLGIPFGSPALTQFSSSKTSAFGVGVMGSPSQAVNFFPAAQSYFLQAEAAQRGYLTGDAQTLFKSGITASFSYLGLTAAQATTYYSSGLANVDWSASPNKIQAIIGQKWAANCYIDGMEAWTDLRRTGFPSDLPQSLDPTRVNPTPPVRLLYPTAEYSNNTGAVNAQGKIDQFSSKIFWQ